MSKVPVDPIKDVTNPIMDRLTKAISPAAFNQLKDISKDVSRKADMAIEWGISTERAENYLEDKAHQAIGIVLNDLDRADGKKDGKISKALVEKKLEGIFKDPEKSAVENKALRTKLHKALEENFFKDCSIKGDEKHLSKAVLTAKFNKQADAGIAKFVQMVDYNHDGVLDNADKKLMLHAVTNKLPEKKFDFSHPGSIPLVPAPFKPMNGPYPVDHSHDLDWKTAPRTLRAEGAKAKAKGIN